MARMPNPRVLVEVLRSGNLRARLRAARDGQAALRLQLIAAALDLGLLDALARGAASTAALADRLGATDPDLLAAYLRVLTAAGLVAGEDSWALTGAGRAIVDDDQVRATYEGSAATTPTSTGSCDRCSPAPCDAATSRSKPSSSPGSPPSWSHCSTTYSPGPSESADPAECSTSGAAPACTWRRCSRRLRTRSAWAWTSIRMPPRWPGAP